MSSFYPLPRAHARDTGSGGVFLIGQAERYDPEINKPLSMVTWTRDVPLRTDVTMGDQFASWSNMAMAQTGGLGGASAPTAGSGTNSGISWLSEAATSLPAANVLAAKTVQPVRPWGSSIIFTADEAAVAQQTQQPLESTKWEALNLKFQLDVDQLVYVGDPTQSGFTGLINSPNVTPLNVSTLDGQTTWPQKIANLTPPAGSQAILNDVNTLINYVWQQSAWSAPPTTLLVTPANYALLAGNFVTTAGNTNILNYIRTNNLTTTQTGVPLDIQPLKWLPGAGVGGANRMLAYTRDPKYVRFPLVPLSFSPPGPAVLSSDGPDPCFGVDVA